MSNQDVRVIIDEIAKLSQTEIQPGEFYREVLSRLTPRLGAAGAAVWLSAGESVELLCQQGLDNVSLMNGHYVQHQQLLAGVQQSGQPNLIHPGMNTDGSGLTNPTPYLLSVCPIKLGESVVAVMESFQSAEAEPQQQEAALRLMTIVAGVATNYHRALELCWRRSLDSFSHAIHKSLHPTQTAFIIANDGRSVVGCDRLSVVIKRGSRCRIEAISGMDSVHRRANEVRGLENVAKRVLATREALTYPDPSVELPPQLEQAIQSYVDESQTKFLALIPLINDDDQEQQQSEDRRKPPEILGAIVAERFSGEPFMAERVESVAHHASRALANALEHHRVFLLPLWKAIGSMGWLVRARTLPFTLVVSALVIALVLAAIFVQTDFKLTAEGTMQPEERHYVFATVDGTVQELSDKLKQTGEINVEDGETLLVLDNPEIDMRVTNVEGEIDSTNAEIWSIKAFLSYSSSGSGKSTDINQMRAKEAELDVALKNLAVQRELLNEIHGMLTVQSPAKGTVITWDVENLLSSRPLSMGQTLMTVAKLDGEWVLELLLPDKETGHLMDARKEFGEDLVVSYILATEPHKTRYGKIKKVAKSTRLDEKNGLSLLVTVEINKEDIPKLHPSAEVTGRIHVGKRSIGYIWLHDIGEFVQSQFIFRFF